MNKKTFYPLLSALACVVAMACAPAHASESCANSSSLIGNTSYVACQGAREGNLAQAETHNVEFDGVGFEFLDFFGDDGGAGSIDKAAGTLQLATPQSGPFVIGINGGNRYSLYLFYDDNDDIKSIAFDTLGVPKPNGTPGALTHAALFTIRSSPVSAVDVSQVPEPASGALAVLALAAAGLSARRRQG